MKTVAPTLAIILAAAPALAAGPEPVPMDTAVMTPAVAPVAVPGDWVGGYAGLQLGYGFGDFSIDPDDFDADGIIGGFHIGYMWNNGTWVFGPELQYDAADLDIDSGSGTGSFDEVARLKLRVGRDLGRGLLYGSAGLAYANFDGVSGVTSIDFNDNGYVVGLGYDYLMSPRWSVGAEYQYHIFDDFGAAGNDVDFSTIHLRASYHF